MGRARGLWEIRTVRFEEALERHEGGGLSQDEAAEMLGVSERTFRRWRERYHDEGSEGLQDRRLGKASSRRAPEVEILRMLGLYEEVYRGFTVKHFHETVQRRHGYKLGYTVTRLALPTSGRGGLTGRSPPSPAPSCARAGMVGSSLGLPLAASESSVSSNF